MQIVYSISSYQGNTVRGIGPDILSPPPTSGAY